MPSIRLTRMILKRTTYENMINRWNFDLMAVDYVNRFLKEDTAYLSSIDRTARLLKDMTSGRSILDIGGGTCNLWLDFPEDTQLTVVDKSLQMIFAAKQNIPWANYILDDIRYIDKNRLGKFDIVVSTFTLHHISYEHHEKVIKNMVDLCGGNGKILVVDRSFHNREEKEKKEKELSDAGNLGSSGDHSIGILFDCRSDRPIYKLFGAACENFVL